MTTYNQQNQTVQGDQYNVGGNLNITYQMAPPQPIDGATLAEAEARLAQLPTDQVPDPAPLPADSRMIHAPNSLFVGRVDDFKQLARTLKGEAATAAIGQIAAATGLGGIGKTQLASEFAHRYGQYFQGGVFWVSFAQPETIPTEIAQCGGAGHLNLRPDFAHLPLEEQVRAVASAWQSPLPRLLIFDNCEDQNLLAQWRPKSGGCRVIVTSRRGEWDIELGVHTLPLGVLSRAESIELLRKFRPDLAADDPDLDAVAAELGDLPLALHLAGSFLKRYRQTPKAYLEQLWDKDLLNHPSLQGRAAKLSPTDHELHVAKTFALSFNQLDPEDKIDRLALNLLSRAACFAPGEPIPRDLLLSTLTAETDEQTLEDETLAQDEAGEA